MTIYWEQPISNLLRNLRSGIGR